MNLEVYLNVMPLESTEDRYSILCLGSSCTLGHGRRDSSTPLAQRKRKEKTPIWYVVYVEVTDDGI
jgi:hypothetical protein